MVRSLQERMAALQEEWRRERAETQMTLGHLIDALAQVRRRVAGGSIEVEGLGDPHSYRGYYTDLSFEPTTERRPLDEALALCRGLDGMVFMGYKGGRFTMKRSTPVWIASYGHLGERLMGLDVDEDAVLVRLQTEPPE